MKIGLAALSLFFVLGIATNAYAKDAPKAHNFSKSAKTYCINAPVIAVAFFLHTS